MALTDNTRGALLMVFAMASFTFNDAIIKSVTPDMNIGQIMFVRGLMTLIMVYIIARKMGALRPINTIFKPVVMARCLCEVAATILFLTGLSQIDFANVSSIMQSLPLVVTLGAALFLGEPVGWRRWLAIIIGFSGVIIILRPGQDGFTTGSLYLVAAVAATAGRDLLTRKMYSDIPSMTITFFTTLVNTVFGAFLIAPYGGWQPVSAEHISYLFIASILVMVGYQTIIMAMRSGEIAFVAPFRYTSLVFAFFVSILIFNETIDAWTIVGASIVICSGLYTFYRESRKKRRPIAQTSGPIKS
jgi:drug/metabolite transporter (DMT)-like permease